VTVHTADGDRTLRRGPGGRWTNDAVAVTTDARHGALHVALSAPTVAVTRVHVRWRGRMADARLILGDAWERGYGDLEWRGWVPDRVMPWYFATHDGARTHAYGVRTGARAFCFWQIDP
jgi:alpha-galactosidase